MGQKKSAGDAELAIISDPLQRMGLARSLPESSSKSLNVLRHGMRLTREARVFMSPASRSCERRSRNMVPVATTMRRKGFAVSAAA